MASRQTSETYGTGQSFRASIRFFWQRAHFVPRLSAQLCDDSAHQICSEVEMRELFEQRAHTSDGCLGEVGFTWLNIKP